MRNNVVSDLLRITILVCLLHLGCSQPDLVFSESLNVHRAFPFNEDAEHGPLFPVIFNLAANARITANATCGLDRPEVYCKLVEHVLMKPPQCGICDANSTDPAQRHGIDNAIDGSPRWWQSPSVANGNKFEYITITIDMRQRYQVAYMVIKAANSPRPAAWELARSLDGINYHPWEYFARTDEECSDLFGVTAMMGRPKFTSDDQVICSTDFGKINPLEDGEIYASLLNDRPGVDGPSQALVEFTTARYIRLRFVKLHTLTADLMALLGSPRLLDSSETRRYFYSIKDISIGGQCICFGHARDCPTDEEGIARCQCSHNTCGESCEKCCPLFNQRLWKAGTGAHPAACEGCQCHGHAEECHFDPAVALSRQSISITGKYEGGGVCVECQHNTTGINCERCKTGFFRPLGVDKFNPIGCLLCECQEPGSGTTGQCIADEEAMFGDLQPGDCVCLDGFSGPKCDKCAPGFRNYPNCEPCPCNFAGSKNGEACEGDCECKDHVEGDRCERCKSGFFNLDANNVYGCTPCFCFGVTDECESTGWNATKIATLDGWILTDSTGSRILNPSYVNGTPVVAADDTYELDVFYWLAPKEFRNNRLRSYGGKLDYSITFIKGRGDLTGSYTADVDVILEGNGIRIGKGERFFRESTPHHLSVSLQEHGWHHVSLNGIFGEVVTKQQFMTLLANVEKLMIRGTYHTRQLESRLLLATMSQADPSSRETANRLLSVESCSCPTGYAGLSCETCAAGHRRVNQTLYNGICVPCHCHAHATTCDAFNGECRDCQHNTTGFFCEQCMVGYYGIAQSGDPEACQPCGCPLMIATNNFSPTCVAGSSLNLPDDYICTDCPVGYFGPKCEMCSDGFFGNPLVPGNFCQPCVCSNNVDLAAVGNCERLTGKCLKCIGETEGFTCERCKKGSYGNALKHDCQACDCSAFGSEHSDCHRSTGQCTCKPGYEGKKCDRCASGFGQISEGCLPCNCDMTGSVTSECDPVSGQCQCQVGVFGLHCRRCQEGFFGFSASGCSPCSCEGLGAWNQTCEQTYGQCHCKPHMTGRTCDKCEAFHYGITSGKGCDSCLCHQIGSMSAACDPLYGQCKCKPGVSGRTCSECDIGFYGLSNRGCTKCPLCRAPGQVCDRDTGECICPPHTTGERCERCAKNSHNYHPILGCKPCNCSSVGSLGEDCDVVTGKCRCRSSFVGNHCDHCHTGFYDFPACKACLCNMNGTDIETCRDGQCSCEKLTGQCTCRKNVEGLRCDTCQSRSFSLDSANSNGCTSCFCSGKSDKCWQAPYVWKASANRGNKVLFTFTSSSVHSLHRHDQLNRTLAIDVLNFDVTHVTLPHKHYDTPFYWNLPAQFLGDKALSYNGKLRFKLDGEPTEPTHRGRDMGAFPIALLQGNFRIILDYKPLHTSEYGVYEIHFHESRWQNRQSPQFPVTRELLMVALQNLQHLIIRANTQPLPKYLEISDMVLETAGRGNSGSAGARMALGVEMCACPAGYNGSSCQTPANGYYRFHALDFLDNPDHLKLLGDSVPCACHGHSKECELESGKCLNCQDNTAGYHCQECEKGFYGNATKPQQGCRRCACPTEQNSYSETCGMFWNNNVVDYKCDRCQHGFTGDKCETCERGFYGNPALGIPCRPCHCNVWGSDTGFCHPTTGQCLCRGGLMGRDCSKCQVGHVITSMGCVNCMHDYCIETLINEYEGLTGTLDAVNTTGLHLAPLKRMNRLRERVDDLAVVVQSAMGESTSFMDNIFPSLESQFDFDREIRRIMLNANKTATDAIALRESGLVSQANINTVCSDVPLIEQKIRQLVENLRAYILSESSQGSLNVQLILTEAEAIFGDMMSKAGLFSNTSVIAGLSWVESVMSEIRGLKSGGELVETVRNRYRELRKKLEELENYVESDIHVALRNSRRLTIQTGGKLTSIQTNSKLVKGVADNTTNMLETAEKLLKAATHDYNNATQNFEEAQTTIKDFQKALDTLKNASGILEALNPEYRETNLLQAVKHSEALSREAEMLAKLFESSKSEAKDPLKAARAYDKIVQQIDDARNITNVVITTVDNAFMVVFPPAERQLGFRAIAAFNQSTELETEARELLEEDVATLSDQLEEETGRLGGVNATNQRTAVELDRIGDRMYNLPDDLTDRITAASRNASAASESATVSLANADTILAAVNRDLKPEFDKIKHVDTKTLDQAERFVQESRKDVGNLDVSIQDLEGTVKSVNELHKEMSQKIKNLRNIILSAKQAASSLQVSLSPDENGICKRSYEPPIIPSSANSITLTYSTSSPERNALLMYIGNPRSLAIERDFMAVEVVDRRVRFIWNVGDDTKVIQHPDPVLPNDPSHIQQNTWYKIEISRVKNTAQLSVLPMTEALKADPFFINGSSDAGYTRMDLNRSSEMFVGGLPNNVDIPEIRSKDFFGCLGQIAIDGQQIGLWNYKTSEGCSGCTAGAMEGGDGTSFRFNGNGYASAPQIKRYNNKKYTIALTFRTFDENALLFLCANDKEPMGDFISLELKDGRVIFQFYLGGQNHLLVSTNRRFNSGAFVNVRAERNDFVADLTVEDDHIKASLPPNKPDGLELATRSMYFGGVPPGFAFQSKYNITLKPLIGCLKDIQVDVTGVDLLSKNVYHVDVEQGCKKRAIRDVSFSNSNGFVKLPGTALPQNASISFSFATGQADGLLIASLSSNYKSDQNYWTASLQGGRLVLLFNSGTTPVKVQVDKYYDDRVLHTVSLRKQKKKIEVRVDDNPVGAERLTQGGSTILSDVIYVGGAPSSVDLSALTASARSFVGCITGLIINGVLVGFEQLQSFDHAAIGRCEFDAAAPSMEPPIGESLPSALALSRQPRNCAPFPKLSKTPDSWLAVNFGLAIDSRVELVPAKKDLKLFNFTATFRTFHSGGIFMYCENPVGEEVILLSLRSGRLVLTVLDELPEEVITQGNLADGQWHHVQLERKHRRLILQVDKMPPEFMKLSKKFLITVPLFVAGLAENIKPPAGMERTGFRGCIANVTFNEKSVNLLGEDVAKGVGTCHTNVEPAAYFEGNGYATYVEHFWPHGKVQVDMEFRTNSVSGELLLLYDPVKRSFVHLKFADGQMIFNISTSTSSFHATKVFSTKHRLCDGQWHRVQALYVQNVIMIDVDNSKQEFAYATDSSMMLPENVAMYIGGRPASIPANFLPKVPNFAGCIRSLSVNEVVTGFSSMAALHNVLVDSCPLPM